MTEKIEFLREYAKCGIYHNHGYHNSALDDKLRMMDEAVKELQDLAEQLKQERNKAIDIYKQALHMLNDYANTGIADREYRNSLRDLIYKIKSELTAHGEH